MRFLNGICVCLLAGVCVTSSAKAASIVLNPGFETGDFTSWTAQNWGVVDTGGTAGVFPNTGSFFANTGCVSTNCIAPDSSNSANAAWLYQDLITTPGTTY